MEMTNNRKGAIAESQVAAAAIKLGIEVYTPILEGGRFDMLFAFPDGELMRVQCKWAPRQGDTVFVRGDSSVRAAGGGFRRRVYSLSEIDAVAAYCPQLHRCYLVPAAMICGRTQVSLRLTAARNNQFVGVHWAEQYELGAIAQLGEHLHGMQGVAGSSPASSTLFREAA